MATIPPKKVLLVEGATEKRLIPYLMEQRGVVWEPAEKEYVVDIRVAGGLVTAPDILETFLKQSALRVLGVVFDADGMRGAEEHRWAALRNRCAALGIALPEMAAPDGVIGVAGNNIRFGVWMMPDNLCPGMLETFLLRLLKQDEIEGPLFRHAKESVAQASECGAPFKQVHLDKALIHTWLAWQDEPGAQLHQAIIYRKLDSASPNADAFVRWFKELFEV